MEVARWDELTCTSGGVCCGLNTGTTRPENQTATIIIASKINRYEIQHICTRSS